MADNDHSPSPPAKCRFVGDVVGEMDGDVVGPLVGSFVG